MEETYKLEFFDQLVESDESVSMRNDPIFDHLPISMRHFNPIIFTDYCLSIQASQCHYCVPRETFENPSIYSRMEIAVMHRDGSGFVDVENEPFFYDLDVTKELVKRQEIPGVFGYVSVDVIEALYRLLKAREGEGI